MNDIAAVAGQLARLRESLQQKQLELDGVVSFSDTERARSIQFIAKLMQACRGHDRELDNKLAKLKQKLDGNPPLSSLDADLAVIEITPDGLLVRDMIDGMTLSALQARTGAPLRAA